MVWAAPFTLSSISINSANAIRKTSFLRWGATTTLLIVIIVFIHVATTQPTLYHLSALPKYLSASDSLFSVVSGESYWVIAIVDVVLFHLILPRVIANYGRHLLAGLYYSRGNTVRLRGWRAVAHTCIHHFYFRSGHCLRMVCGLCFVWQWSCHF